MAAYLTDIKTAQDLLANKVMAKLRGNPKAFGRVSVEMILQGGKVTNIQATDTDSIKPAP